MASRILDPQSCQSILPILALWMSTTAVTALLVLPALVLVLRPRFLGAPPAAQEPGASGAGTGAGAGRATRNATPMLSA